MEPRVSPFIDAAERVVRIGHDRVLAVLSSGAAAVIPASEVLHRQAEPEFPEAAAYATPGRVIGEVTYPALTAWCNQPGPSFRLAGGGVVTVERPRGASKRIVWPGQIGIRTVDRALILRALRLVIGRNYRGKIQVQDGGGNLTVRFLFEERTLVIMMLAHEDDPGPRLVLRPVSS